MYDSYRGVQSLKQPKYTTRNRRESNNLSSLARVNLFLIASALAVLVFYVIQINSMVGMGYEIDRLSVQREEIDLFNTDLTVKTDFLRSVGLLEAQAKYMNMVDTSNISYLDVSDIIVASNDSSQHN